jgi:hypothetical protein
MVDLTSIWTPEKLDLLDWHSVHAESTQSLSICFHLSPKAFTAYVFLQHSNFCHLTTNGVFIIIL